MSGADARPIARAIGVASDAGHELRGAWRRRGTRER